MKRAVIVGVSLLVLVAVAYLSGSKWLIRHETVAFFDQTRDRPIDVDIAVRRDKAMQARADANKGVTLVSASPLEADLRSFEGDKTAKAKRVGELIAERAKAAGIEAVVFDRGGNKYHGRVAAVADGARENGLAL